MRVDIDIDIDIDIDNSCILLFSRRHGHFNLIIIIFRKIMIYFCEQK